jgi:hypothetical protein
MRALLSLLAAFAVMGLAFWAYHENYATKAALDDVAKLESEIADQRDALAVLNAEWAYLNRPDRLRDLVQLNFDRLGLMPMLPEQFGAVSEVAFPTPDIVQNMSGSVDVSNSGASE